MPTTTPDAVADPLGIVDADLTNAILGAVGNALSMCETTAKCVGLASVPGNERGIVTGLIGVHGRVTGFITANFSERFAVKSVGGLLHENYAELSHQVVDGVGEITNIIVGGIKGTLANTPWGFSNITVPSVIVGKGYQMAFARGLDFICATFEHDDQEAIMLEDRLLHVSASLLRL